MWDPDLMKPAQNGRGSIRKEVYRYSTNWELRMVADPHHFNADPDPVPPESDGNLWPLVFTPSRAPLSLQASMSPCEHTALRGSILCLWSFWILTYLMRIWIQLFTVMRIRIQLPKIMRIHAVKIPGKIPVFSSISHLFEDRELQILPSLLLLVKGGKRI